MQFRTGWHYQSFHTFLCKTLTHELHEARATLERHKQGQDVSDEIWLRWLGLSRLREVLLNLDRCTPAPLHHSSAQLRCALRTRQHVTSLAETWLTPLRCSRLGAP